MLRKIINFYYFLCVKYIKIKISFKRNLEFNVIFEKFILLLIILLFEDCPSLYYIVFI